MRRWGSYEDYAQERDDEMEKKAHDAGECQDWCPYCADDEEQMSKDVDEMAEHVNKELGEQALIALEKIKSAIHAYHSALDNRQHGGVAQNHAIQEIEKILNLPWLPR